MPVERAPGSSLWGSCRGAQEDRSPWGCLAPTHSQVACSENSRGEWEGGKQTPGHSPPPPPNRPNPHVDLLCLPVPCSMPWALSPDGGSGS